MNQQKLIDQIHSEFDTAQDRLLQQANEILNKSHGKENVSDIAARLNKIGFVNVPMVKEVSKSNEQAELIRHYKEAYPFLKFLTENELDRICKKYGLIYNPVENFVGNIPFKNIQDIENAQARKATDSPEDLIYCELERDTTFCLVGDGDWTGIWGSQWYRIPNRLDGVHFRHQNEANDYLRDNFNFTAKYLVKKVINYEQNRQGLFICAPKSQFKGKNKSITFIEPKDPIVFRYVKGGIQVITKWGLEANDPALVVPVLN